MTTPAQKRESCGSSSIAMSDLRHRQDMEQSNCAFLAALERYFLARDLWAK